jgi:hypothetical protein
MCWPREEYLLKEFKGDTFASLDVTYTHISYICIYKVKLVVQLLFNR